MESVSAWLLSGKEKSKLISILSPELLLLRTKAEISQEELAGLIGISRQTYGSIERGTRVMSWSTFLSLVLFFDYNKKTHQMLRKLDGIPQQVLKKFNENMPLKEVNLDVFLGEGTDLVIKSLDEQAIRSIRTMILVEYARCTSTSGDVILKSFDGVNFSFSKVEADIVAAKALKNLKEKRKVHDKS